MVLKDGSQTTTRRRAVTWVLAVVTVLSLAACGTSGVLAGPTQNDGGQASFQNAFASMCEPVTPNEAPQKGGAGRRL